jgi:photosystem II stability/assembly factor-like uncharacterized protein
MWKKEVLTLGCIAIIAMPQISLGQSQPSTWKPISQTISPSIHKLISIDTFLFAGAEDGLYRSENGGINWSRVADDRLQNRILNLVPLDRRLVVHASGTAYWYSDDLGNTWDRWYHPTGNPFLSRDAVLDTGMLAIRSAVPVHGGFLIAARAKKGVWKFRHLGLDYQITSSGLDSNTTHGFFQVGSTLFAAVDIDQAVPYSSTFIMASHDLGQTWFRPTGPICSDNRIHSIVGVESRFFATNQSGTLYSSSDSGKSWEVSSTAPPSEDPMDLQRTIVSTPNGLLVLGSIQDIRVSEDTGKTWNLRWSSPGPSYSMSFTTLGNVLVLAETAGLFISRDSGRNWEKRRNPGDPTYMPRLSVSSGNLWADVNGNVHVSQDAGLTWSWSVPGTLMLAGKWSQPYQRGDSARFLEAGYYTPDGGKEWIRAGVHPRVHRRVQRGNHIALVTNLGFHESRDNGISWKSRNRIQEGGSINDWGDSDIHDLKCFGDTLYVGTERGLYTKRLSDTVWTTVSDVRHAVMRIEKAGSLLYATGKLINETRVSLSNDHGRSWQTLGAMNPDSPIQSFFDLIPVEGGWVAGTKSGMYRSQDQGKNWSRSHSGLWPGKIPALAYLQPLLSHQSVLWVGLNRPLHLDGQLLYRSLDSGVTWNGIALQSPTYAIGPEAASFRALISSGARLFFFSGAQVWMTENNCATWSHPEKGWPKLNPRDVHGSDSLLAAITGPRQVLILRNPHLEWQELPLPVDLGMDSVTAIAVISNRILAAVGGRLLITDDQGKTWMPQDFFCDRGWKLASDGLKVFVYSTGCGKLSMDGGRTWLSVPVQNMAGSVSIQIGISEFEIRSTVTTTIARINSHQLITTVYRSPDGGTWSVNPEGPLAVTKLGGREYAIGDSVVFFRALSSSVAIAQPRLIAGQTPVGVNAFQDLGLQSGWRHLSLKVSRSGYLKIFQISPDGRMQTLLNQVRIGPGSHEFRFKIPSSPGQFLFANWNGKTFRFLAKPNL